MWIRDTRHGLDKGYAYVYAGYEDDENGNGERKEKSYAI